MKRVKAKKFNQYNNEDIRLRHIQTAAIIVWALVLVAVIVRWAVGV